VLEDGWVNESCSPVKIQFSFTLVNILNLFQKEKARLESSQAGCHCGEETSSPPALFVLVKKFTKLSGPAWRDSRPWPAAKKQGRSSKRTGLAALGL
jgi:hypothetical protein